MKAKEIRELALADLVAKEKELSEETFRLRLKLKSKQVDKNTDYCKTKKDLARIKTVIKEKQSAQTSERERVS